MDKTTRRMSLAPGRLELREAEAGAGARTVSGYAIRFDEPSVPLWGDITERIAPSCVTEETLAESDVKMTLFHNRESLLARWNRGEGSLRLSVDRRGVRFEFEPADDEFGRFCVEHIERGDLSGCSFTFIPGDYTTDVRADGMDVTHTRFERLLEMTIGTDPAYTTTSVEAREFAERVRRAAGRDGESLRGAAEAESAARAERERQIRAAEVALAAIDIAL